MSIEFRCQNCTRLLRTPDETAGKEAKCPDCGSITPIPESPPSATPKPSGENPFSQQFTAPGPPSVPPGEENPMETTKKTQLTARAALLVAAASLCLSGWVVGCQSKPTDSVTTDPATTAPKS